MSDATLHQDIETPKASDADIRRSDADTVVGLGDSKNQAIGYTPTDPKKPGSIQNAPDSLSNRAHRPETIGVAIGCDDHHRYSQYLTLARVFQASIRGSWS